MRVPLLLSGLGLALNMLRRLMIRVIILLDNLLIFGNTLEEIQMAQESLIFLLQHLGFVINFKKCILNQPRRYFLGLIINSETMTLSLPLQKVKK